MLPRSCGENKERVQKNKYGNLIARPKGPISDSPIFCRLEFKFMGPDNYMSLGKVQNDTT